MQLPKIITADPCFSFSFHFCTEKNFYLDSSFLFSPLDKFECREVCDERKCERKRKEMPDDPESNWMREDVF